MMEEFKMLGELPATEIAQKLREIGDDEAAEFYELQATNETPFLPEGFFKPRRWLDTEHQYGFIPLFKPGKNRFHKVISASHMEADTSLMNQRVNISLDRLSAYDYPPPLINLGSNIHTILFTFEARNQIAGGSEAIAFNQTYQARSGQGVAVSGNRIFIGLTIGPNGVDFSAETVNVGNSNDEKLIAAMTSEATGAGLSLLTTAQPALVPFVNFAKQLGLLAGSRQRNTPVQRFHLGLDFDNGALGARIALGSYVVVQVRRPDEVTWSDWAYDAETGTIVRTKLAEGEEPYALPYNMIIFRVSRYQE